MSPLTSIFGSRSSRIQATSAYIAPPKNEIAWMTATAHNIMGVYWLLRAITLANAVLGTAKHSGVPFRLLFAILFPLPRARNRAAHRLALQNCWYCYFDPETKGILSCDASHPEAHLDICRGLAALSGEDPGPETRESWLKRSVENLKDPSMRTS